MEYAQLFKIFSDDTRLRLLALLFENELHVTDLEQILETSQSNVSRHLAKLSSHGLVGTRRSKHHIFYHMDPVAFVTWPFLDGLLCQLKNRPQGAADLDRLARLREFNSKRAFMLTKTYSHEDLI